MTKNTQGSEWEKRFDQTFSSDDLHVSGIKKWTDFIDQEITASNKALLQKVREIVSKKLRLPVDDVVELKDELLEKLAKLEGEI
ncbi:hypothetical protein KBC79_01420 [Candidatus Woesebacteria bacterium]|nr:hypothetical protein [Candidatus Woesebacteria bacterium]